MAEGTVQLIMCICRSGHKHDYLGRIGAKSWGLKGASENTNKKYCVHCYSNKRHVRSITLVFSQLEHCLAGQLDTSGDTKIRAVELRLYHNGLIASLHVSKRHNLTRPAVVMGGPVSCLRNRVCLQLCRLCNRVV